MRKEAGLQATAHCCGSPPLLCSARVRVLTLLVRLGWCDHGEYHVCGVHVERVRSVRVVLAALD